MPETFEEKTNRILRDHEGYTGDGQGGVGALPTGDRSTARKPISKRDLREALLGFGEDAQAYVDAAEASATEAALYDGPKVDTFAEVASVTAPQVGVGGLLRVVELGAVYERADDGATDPDLDYSGSGGVKWNLSEEIRATPSMLGIVGPVLIPSHFQNLQGVFNKFGPYPSPIEVRIEAGHALTKGLLLVGGDYSNYKITSDDATVYLDAGFVGVDGSETTGAGFAEGSTDDLFVFADCAPPALACLVDMAGAHGSGYLLGLGGSAGFIEADAGVINAGRVGLLVRSGGCVSARSTKWAGAQYNGGKITSAATADVAGADFDNAWASLGSPTLDGALHVSRGSQVWAQAVTVRNSGAVGISCRRSWCGASDAIVTGGADRGCDAREGGYIILNDATVTGNADNDLSVFTYGGFIHAHGATYGTTTQEVNQYTSKGAILDQTVLGLHPYGATIELADDAVFGMDFPGFTNNTRGCTIAVATNNFNQSGLVWLRAVSSNAQLIAGGTGLAVATGIPTGTTGADGKVTIFSNNQKIYVENRSGAATKIGLAFLAFADG
ncbi:hypothetical protein J7354_01590 [Sulfitobacter sp. R18_2]|uniref:hypothetical protein n=1 Tax=Sulfitobacter sp. R18_2 TaxID=2821105 RepID=UPI001ADBEB44|nr:hypothetical protein [Sulfitobacter sp. R18_2]MBO9437343.1 hypothetical protein [Sulfitobacter sp. R18_2]